MNESSGSIHMMLRTVLDIADDRQRSVSYAGLNLSDVGLQNLARELRAIVAERDDLRSSLASARRESREWEKRHAEAVRAHSEVMLDLALVVARSIITEDKR